MTSSGIRTYAEARELVGQKQIAGYAGGWTRKIRFIDAGEGRIEARLHDTAVVTFTPEGFEIRTGGWTTLSTFDAIATALGISRARVGTVKRVPYVNGHRVTEGMLIDYDGFLVRAGETEAALAPPRGQ